MKFVLITLILMLAFILDSVAQKYVLSLNDVINSALISSLESKVMDIDKVVLETNILLNKKAYLPTMSLSLSAPNYNRSIIPILQPDGTRLFREVHSASYSSALELQYPVWLTGGNIAVQSSINQLFNFGDINSTSIGGNLFHISISQPLSFYSSQKWDKKIAEIKNEDKKKDILREKVSIKQEAIFKYFNLLIAQESNILIENIYHYSEVLYEKSLIRFENKQISHQDLLKIKISVNDAKIRLDDVSNSYMIAKKDLVSFLKLSNDVSLELTLPNDLNSLVINEEFAVERTIKSNITDKQLINALSSNKEIKYNKSQLFGNGNISISAGMNSTSETFSNIYQDNKKQQGVSVSLSIPIVGWNIASENYKLSKLKAEKSSIDLLIGENKLITDLVTDLKSFNLYILKHQNLKENVNLKEENLNISGKLLENGRIDIIEYKNAENAFIEAKINQIQLLRDIWVRYIKIESNTLFDFIQNVEE